MWKILDEKKTTILLSTEQWRTVSAMLPKEWARKAATNKQKYRKFQNNVFPLWVCFDIRQKVWLSSNPNLAGIVVGLSEW
jgi:hypothetical protein